jgi:hypothetical protein
MRMTKAQAAAITHLILALDVDDLLLVRIREDPSKGVGRGVLEVSLKDHWAREVRRVDRSGHVSYPFEAPATQIPGQMAIPT